jgi:hypothetical protein
MTQRTDTTPLVVEGQQESSESKPTCPPETRKVPVAYEEITLTEEAAEILEAEQKAASERPPRKLRRVATGTPASPDN